MKRDHINVLVATNHLDSLGGTETYTYALIEELVKRENIKVEYFTFKKGEVSNRIENDLNVSFLSKKKYDLILANHNKVIDELYFKGITVQTCHGIYPDLEQPSYNADFYVAVSLEVQNHLKGLGFDSKIILNGINNERFKPVKRVNDRMTNVLSLCQSELANDILKCCCEELELNFKSLNKFRNPIWNVENLINDADIVIGLGRSVYEAMSCGRPIIVFDDRPYFDSMGDGYVKEFLEYSILNNCSGRYLKKRFDKELLKKELLKYKSGDSIFFRDYAIANLNIKIVVDNYLEFYSKNTFRSRLNKEIKIIRFKIYRIKRKMIKYIIE